MLFRVTCVGKASGDESFKIGRTYLVLHVFDNSELLIPDDNNELRVVSPTKFIYIYDEEAKVR